MNDDFWYRALADLDLSLPAPATTAAPSTVWDHLLHDWAEMTLAQRKNTLEGVCALAVHADPSPGAGEAAIRDFVRRLMERYSTASIMVDIERIAAVATAAPRQETPRRSRVLHYPRGYYADALSMKLPAWSAKWWPQMFSDFDQHFDALAAKRRYARRIAREI